MKTKTKTIIAAAAIIALAAAAYYLYTESNKPEYVRSIAGVPYIQRYQ